MPSVLPISAIIPTLNRPDALERTMRSIAAQSHQPANIIVNDASDDASTQAVCEGHIPNLLSKVCYQRCRERGAATQRNEAATLVDQPFIFFLDDDILLDDHCIVRLWACMEDESVGGANAMIRNQRYTKPSTLTRWCYRFLHGRSLPSYAGRCLGPAVNLLPEDDPNLPEIVPVEWLNSTCAVYRREVLPSPIFPDHFHGYSLFEDVTLSLTVGNRFRLVNARTARIYHDSQPGDHKASLFAVTRMELVNRHYVTTRILERCRLRHLCGMGLWQAYKLFALIKRPRDWNHVLPTAAGTLAGMSDILTKRPA